MVEVNLRTYEKFWDTFREDVAYTTGDNITVPSSTYATKWIKEWYNIDVSIPQYGLLGLCYMTEEQYSWFLLRWA